MIHLHITLKVLLLGRAFDVIVYFLAGSVESTPVWFRIEGKSLVFIKTSYIAENDGIDIRRYEPGYHTEHRDTFELTKFLLYLLWTRISYAQPVFETPAVGAAICVRR